MGNIPLPHSSMTKILYTPEQIGILKENKYIKDCSPKYITFTDQCKIEALELDKDGWYFRDIFRHLGFPEFFVDSIISKQTIKNWRHALRIK